MCHSPGSRPPAPPRSGTVGATASSTLTAADGTEFTVSTALPAERARTGAVILPDVRGLHPYYVALAERFAEAGVAAVAIDWFGRTAGVAGTGTRGADFDYQQHVPRTTPEGIDADVTAAIAHLRAQAGEDLPVVAVGFCFGGSHAWRLAGGDLDLAGCAGFYGRPSLVGDAADRAHLPTVVLIAGADTATPVEDQQALAERMRAAGADVDAVVYDGAPHSFFDRSSEDWAEACRDAWEHVLALTDRVARS
ncbi:dienelactone hydrolase family protein [Blastococcus sp. TBT05-19]|uniref:dienelactone hydrolase family protein n=1 Tax=Blastococcus sp. TBT05-19 TaxID=2250581 RepID=UPI000DEAECBF|nr:dienelactone hydrolase family protein [Blastococcus sp. TBT05-19]RBY90442.1 dienelactone hydrolase family protein [Blastococcus sp. TBT05-19]